MTIDLPGIWALLWNISGHGVQQFGEHIIHKCCNKIAGRPVVFIDPSVMPQERVCINL